MQSRRNRNRRTKSRKDVLLSNSDRTVGALNRLIDLESTQVRGITPTVPDVPRLLITRNKVHTFERTYSLPVILAPNSTDVSGAIGPSLSQFSGASDLIALFDQYRIIQIQIDFIPSATQGAQTPLYSAIDYDDYTVASGLADLLQYDTLMVTQSLAVHSRTFSPRIAVAAYGGIAFTSYANSSSMTWIDVASPNVNYYGLKYYWPSGPSVGAFTPIVRGIIQCRATR